MTAGGSKEEKNEAPSPKNIIIIGGSCAGLFAGVALTRLGHNVDILESAVKSARYGMAAGIGLASHVKAFLEKHDRLAHVPFSLPSECFHVLGENLETQRTLLHGYNLTSWDSMYYRLRANFDGFESSYYPHPPPRQATDGRATFHAGARALDAWEVGDELVVKTEDVTTGASREYRADYVVVADGGNSAFRQQLEPTALRKAPGYMVWRGTVPAKDVSPELVSKLKGYSALYAVPGQKSYCVIYTIPGENGALGDDEKVVNLVWYHWPSDFSREEILTGVDGHRHRTTLPKGKMRPEVWATQVASARKLMHPAIADMISKIDQPFASIISSIISTKSAYLNNRLFFIGDAFAQVQPNAGQGTNLAAKTALALCDVISGKTAVSAFENDVLSEAREQNDRAIELGAKFMGPEC